MYAVFSFAEKIRAALARLFSAMLAIVSFCRNVIIITCNSYINLVIPSEARNPMNMEYDIRCYRQVLVFL